MDRNIIIASYHEAGHALSAHIVGWSIKTVILVVKNETLIEGKTRYDYGNDQDNNLQNLNRRLMCLLGGPIAQALLEEDLYIDINNLGHDGKLLLEILDSVDPKLKKHVNIQELFNSTGEILSHYNCKKALNLIAQKAIQDFQLTQKEFLELINGLKICRMNFE